MSTITLNIEDDLKQKLDKLLCELGMDLNTFFTVYAERALQDRCIPFDITTIEDPFYSECNINQIRHSVSQARLGKTIAKSLAELETIENE